MKTGKIKIILSWDDDMYSCQFGRGRDTEEWQNMTCDEQVKAVNTMISMADLFGKFIKEVQ